MSNFILNRISYTITIHQFNSFQFIVHRQFANRDYNHNRYNSYLRHMERLQKLNNDLGKQEEFQYTTDKGCLTLEQRRFYEENGYIVIKNFLKHADIDRWTARFKEYCNKNLQPLPGMQIVRDISLAKKDKQNYKNLVGEQNITKVQDFQFDEVLQTYCTNPDLVPYLKSFCGNNIKSVHTMFINKPPHMGESSRHPFHQDLAYFPFGPANKIVAAWAALQDSNIENGSLHVFPKTHKGRFYDHSYPTEGEVNKAYFGIKEYENFSGQKIDLQMKKGDIVFFHPLLIHGSGINKSKGYRKSMCCHFAASQCKYIPIEGTVQELVAKQIMGYLQKKKAKDPTIGFQSYHQLWRFKAALVAGEQFEDGL